MATPARPRQSGIPAPGRASSIPTPGRPRSASSLYQNAPLSPDSTNEMSRAFADAIRANDPAQHRFGPALASSSSSSLSPKSASLAQSGRRSVAGRPSSVASSSSALSASTRAGAKTPLSTRPSSRAQSRQCDILTATAKPRTFEVGDNVRIESLGFEGVLRYLGEIDGKSGLWAGVQLGGGFAGKGKNNGTAGGVHYFKCPDNCGVFVAISKLSAPTVGLGANRPPSAASSRNGRATPAMSGRVTPSFSTSFSTSRTPSASFSNGRITPANGRVTPSASTARIPPVKTPSYKPRVVTAVQTPISLAEKITVGSRASKYMSMTAKDLSSRDGPKTFAPSSPIPSTSPKNAQLVASPTRAPGSPFTTPKPLTNSKLAGIGFGKGRPSGTPRARVPSGVSMPPPASPFSKAPALQDEDLPDDSDAHSEGPIFTGRLTYSRPGSSASFRSGSTDETSLVSRLQSRLDAMEYDNERLRISVANQPEAASVPEDNEELDQLKSIHQETLAQVLQLQQELSNSRAQSLKQETHLKQSLEQARKDTEDQKQLDADLLLSVRGELETSTKEVLQLQLLCEEREVRITAINHDLQSKEAEIATLNLRLDSTALELEEERKELGIQIDELRIAGQETIALYEERLNDVESQRYDLELRLDSLLDKASMHTQSPAASKSEINQSAAEIDNETLREQVQHLQKKISTLEEIIEDSRSNAEKLEDNVRERMKRLKEKEESMKKELNEGRKEVERMSRSEVGARNRVEEIEEALRESAIALESARAETEILRSELADLDNLVEGNGDSDISTRVVEYTRRIASEREKNENEIAQLRRLVRDQQASSPGKDTHSLQEELVRLKSLNDDLDEELVRTRSDLEDKDRDIRDLKKKIRDVPVINGSLDTSKGLPPPSSKDGAKEELAGMKHIIQELQKENSSAQQRIKLLESENKLLKSEAEQLRQEVAILEENLDSGMAKEDGDDGGPTMSDDVVSLQRKLRDQGAELEQLRKKLSELDMKHARTIHDLNKEISEMEALVESKIYREDELEQEIERLKEKVSRYKKSSKTPPLEGGETQRLSVVSTSSAASEGTCEICERPGHDIFNCDLLKDDTRRASAASVEPYCEDCETYGHLPADCPHSQDVF